MKVEEIKLAFETNVQLAAPNLGEYTAKANQIEKDFINEYKKQILNVQSTVVKYNNMIADVANSFDEDVNSYKLKVKDLGLDYESTPISKIAVSAKKSILNKPDFFRTIMDKLKSI